MNTMILRNIAIGLGAVVLLSYSTTFIVDKTQYAIAIRLGTARDAILEPGLNFKFPIITKVIYVDNRLLTYDADPGSVFTKDKKEMIVGYFLRGNIIFLFYSIVLY